MGMVRVEVGFTESDRAADYIPMMDGYRDGAAQLVVAFDLDAGDATDEHVCDALFTATNVPVRVMARYPLAVTASIALVGSRQPFRSLSVGDTVTVDGRRYACAPVGWVKV